ncbi:MAG: hypothetical protein ABW175_20020 [Bradyrhizobium sp.]
MSGGYIRAQKEGEHQVVIFTFIGPVTQEQRDQWNERVLELKNSFVNDKAKSYLAGVTIQGDPTPPKLAGKKKKKK